MSPSLLPPSSNSEHPHQSGRGPSPQSPSPPPTPLPPPTFRQAKMRAVALSSVSRLTPAATALPTTARRSTRIKLGPASRLTRVTMRRRSTRRFRSPARRRPPPPTSSSAKPILLTRETGFKIRAARSPSHPRSSPTSTLGRSATSHSHRVRSSPRIAQRPTSPAIAPPPLTSAR